MVAKKTPAKKAPAKKRAGMNPGSVVSGMPDGSTVAYRAPSTRDDLEAAYDFVKKQRPRSSK